MFFTDLFTLSLHDALPISAFLATSKMVVGERAVGIPLVVERVGRGPECDDRLAGLQVVVEMDHLFIRQLSEPCERSEEHTSELQSRGHLVCRLLLENKHYL